MHGPIITGRRVACALPVPARAPELAGAGGGQL